MSVLALLCHWIQTPNKQSRMAGKGTRQASASKASDAMQRHYNWGHFAACTFNLQIFPEWCGVCHFYIALCGQPFFSWQPGDGGGGIPSWLPRLLPLRLCWLDVEGIEHRSQPLLRNIAELHLTPLNLLSPCISWTWSYFTHGGISRFLHASPMEE